MQKTKYNYNLRAYTSFENVNNSIAYKYLC